MKFALRHRSSIRTRPRFSDAVSLALVVSLLLVPAVRAQPLQLGFSDATFGSGDPAARSTALAQAGSVGAQIVRVEAVWSGAAPTRPRHPADPSDPAYQWNSLDAAVTDAVAAGLAPL